MMHLIRKAAFIILAAAALGLPACLVIDTPYNGLPPGTWRGVIKFEPSYITPNPKGKPLPEKLNMEYEDVTQGELPFLFTVSYPSPDSFFLTLMLGGRQLILSDYMVGKDFSTAKDTITIRFPGSYHYIRGIFEEKILEGDWVFADAGGNEKRIPFTARQGQDYLFTTLRKPPAMDLSGVWSMRTGIEKDTTGDARLELIQSGNMLQGILEWKGRRYEYLSGTVQARKLYLSYFDGEDAILIEGKLDDDGALLGAMRSGKEEKTLWQASKTNEINNK